MSNGTTNTPIPVSLVPQTGMPTLHTSRSRELIYDALQDDPSFQKNPFGPQRLDLSRTNHRWN
jgi:hypothetical protein